MSLGNFFTGRKVNDLNLQRIIDLKVKIKTTKLLEEHIGVNLHDLGLDNDLLEMTPKAWL